MHRYPARRRAVAASMKAVRKRAKLSQRALSARLGESHNYAHFIESLQYSATVEKFIAWCEECGADPHDVLDDILAAGPRRRRRARKA